MLLPRFVLCLSLLTATAGFAQDSKVPPSAPEESAPRDEIFPREQKEDTWDAARAAGRLLLQPPAGILAGALGGLVGIYPVFGLSFVFCDAIHDGSKATDCALLLTYAGTALSVSIGAGLGVLGVGHLLDGKARFDATIAGALAGSAVGAVIGLSSGLNVYEMAPLLLLGPVLGATLLYALSETYFPDPKRLAAPARKDKDKDKDEDEYGDGYACVLPMVSTTRTGGIIGGLVGRF
jgi:hypothetical protein